MTKAVNIPMSESGMSINVGSDGVWLCFKAKNGNQCAFNVDAMIERERGKVDGGRSDSFVGVALASWADDRIEQARRQQIVP